MCRSERGLTIRVKGGNVNGHRDEEFRYIPSYRYEPGVHWASPAQIFGALAECSICES